MADKLSVPDYVGQRTRRVLGRSWFSRGTAAAIFIRVVIPAGFAFLAYLLAGHAKAEVSTKAELGTIQNLIQLAIALVAGVAVFTIITEITLERLPGQLSQELEIVAGELRPIEACLNELTANLSTLSEAVSKLNEAANNQLRQLIDMYGIEVLFTETRVLEKAEALQADAEHRVEAMWSLLPYDKALKDYFAETLSDGDRHTSRIVAARTVKEEHLIDHIHETWKRLADSKYEIYLVHDCNYEVVIADGKKAGLFIYSKHGFESCCMSSDDSRFVDAVEGLVQGLRRIGEQVPVPEGATEEEHLDYIKEWVHNYYRTVPQ